MHTRSHSSGLGKYTVGFFPPCPPASARILFCSDDSTIFGGGRNQASLGSQARKWVFFAWGCFVYSSMYGTAAFHPGREEGVRIIVLSLSFSVYPIRTVLSSIPLPRRLPAKGNCDDLRRGSRSGLDFFAVSLIIRYLNRSLALGASACSHRQLVTASKEFGSATPHVDCPIFFPGQVRGSRRD
ncbi:hypothetical protein CPB85DRAFT_105050 [Mucidula mucida]|nr:hypothetical protein CPB85DRAFT_105050 [Mucidula mucida]